MDEYIMINEIENHAVGVTVEDNKLYLIAYGSYCEPNEMIKMQLTAKQARQIALLLMLSAEDV